MNALRSGNDRIDKPQDPSLLPGEIRAQLPKGFDALPDAAVRTGLAENLATAGDYVIVNYSRPALGQEGSGHISPLGAYDEA